MISERLEVLLTPSSSPSRFLLTTTNSQAAGNSIHTEVHFSPPPWTSVSWHYSLTPYTYTLPLHSTVLHLTLTPYLYTLKSYTLHLHLTHTLYSLTPYPTLTPRSLNPAVLHLTVTPYIYTMNLYILTLQPYTLHEPLYPHISIHENISLVNKLWKM